MVFRDMLGLHFSPTRPFEDELRQHPLAEFVIGVIGQAQAASGQYAAAAATFAGVQQSNGASARVVRLWGYFVKSKASPATAAAQ